MDKNDASMMAALSLLFVCNPFNYGLYMQSRSKVGIGSDELMMHDANFRVLAVSIFESRHKD